MSKLTQEEKRIRIAKACGVQPRRMWRVFYDNARQTGAIRIPTQDAALIRAEYERQSAERLNCPCEVAEPEEYDDYDHAPDYFNDLNAVHEAEKVLVDRQQEYYYAELAKQKSFYEWVSATAAQRAEALGLTLKLWEPGQ